MTSLSYDKSSAASKIRWLCYGNHLDTQSESNFEFAASELSEAVRKLEKAKYRETDDDDEIGAEEKRLRAYKATLLLKAIYNLEEQLRQQDEEKQRRMMELELMAGSMAMEASMSSVSGALEEDEENYGEVGGENEVDEDDGEDDEEDATEEDDEEDDEVEGEEFSDEG